MHTVRPSRCPTCGRSDAPSRIPLPTPFPVNEEHHFSVSAQFVASPQAYEAAQRVIVDGKANISALEGEIEQLQGQIQSMKEVVRRHQAYMSPIFRLTDDALLLVMKECSNGWARASWRLSAVCKRWREVALSSHALWSTVTFNPDFRKLYTGNIELMLQTQLARSASCSLSLSMGSKRLVPEDPHTSLLYTPYSLLSTGAVRYITLKVDGRMPRDWANATCSSLNFSALKTLFVSDSSWFHGPFFRNTPHLTDLTLQRAKAVDTANIPFDVSMLEKVHLISSHFTTGGLLRLLRRTTRLRTLIIEFDQITYWPATTQPTVELQQLRSLSMTTPDNLPFLARLRAPQLKHLHLSEFSPANVADVRRFLQHDGETQLESLAIEDFDSQNPAELLGLLSERRMLQILSLGYFTHPHAIDSLLKALRWNPCITPDLQPLLRRDEELHTLPLCPNLRRLELGNMQLRSPLFEGLDRSRSAAVIARGEYVGILGPSCPLEVVRGPCVVLTDEIGEVDDGWVEEIHGWMYGS